MYGVLGKTFSHSKEVIEIEELIKTIEKLDGRTVTARLDNNYQRLNKMDLEYIRLNEELVNKIIYLSKISHQKIVSLVNRTYFKSDGYNIKENLDVFLESLNFYKEIENSINYSLIEFTEKMLDRFEMGIKDTIKYTTYLADAYFDVGEERKATDIILALINKYPNYDEPYQTMINWYMYKKENIKGLENVLRKAKNNEHWLISGSFT